MGASCAAPGRFYTSVRWYVPGSWGELEGASPSTLQAASKTIKTATNRDPVSHHLHVSKHRQLALSTETHVCFCFNWAAEERTPKWLEIAYSEVKNSICSREAYRWCSWQGSRRAAVSQSPGSALAREARAVQVANIQAWLPNQKKVFKTSAQINLNHFPEAQRDGGRGGRRGGTEKCPSLLFHISLFRFQSLEWKVEGTKGQAGPIPSLSHSPAVKESRIWLMQIHFFLPFFWRDSIPTSPIHFTRVSQKSSSGLSEHDPSVKASWSPG